MEDAKGISLPRLNRLSPTLESTALKLMEEAGELGAAIGKYRGLSGEQVAEDQTEILRRIGRELLDVAQTAVTMMYVLEEHYQVDIERLLSEHVEKLYRRGYVGS